MLTKLKIKFKTEDVDYNTASLFQGVIMQQIDSDYAELLHQNAIRPYSQSLYKDENKNIIWQINSLNEKSRIEIIDKLNNDNFKTIYLQHKDKKIEIIDKSIIETSYKEIFEKNYLSSDHSRFANFTFNSPTAFKSNGLYINFPTIQLIFHSLLSKYNACSDFTNLEDDGLIEEINNYIRINKYQLKSTVFHLEGRTIPSFKGAITLKSYGNEKLTRLMNMLIEFGTYSGIGIKSAIGMGAISINDYRRGDKNARN